MEPSSSARHLGYLDGLRALTAIYVLLCHAFLEVDFSHQPLSQGAKIFLQFFFFGHFAVDLFIVLSGFCLMLPVVMGDGTLRGGALNFIGRRAWRIVPPYYFAMALSLLLISLVIGQKTGTHWDVSVPVTSKSILVHLLLVQDLLGCEANINHVFWSISVEWRIYFLFPLLVLCWRRFGALPTTISAIILSYLTLQVSVRFLGGTFAVHYIGLFAMGIFAANVIFGDDRVAAAWRRLPWSLIMGFMTLIVFLMFFPRLWDGPLTKVYVADYIVGAWSMILLVAVSCNERGWMSKLLSCKPLTFVGTFAYSIYLIHAPLLQFLWQYIFTSLQTKPLSMFVALTMIGTPAIIGSAYVFFLAFERPFFGRGKKRDKPLLAAVAELQPAR